MEHPDILTHSAFFLHPEPARTVIRPFMVEDPEGFRDAKRSRAQRIVDSIRALDETTLAETLAATMASLTERHRDIETVLLRRFEELDTATDGLEVSGATREQALLIGAYFSEEYSYEAAALFNPSMVAHPDQSGVEAGRVRFVMSLRCIGEGHVSSLGFRTGTWGAEGDIVVDPASAWSVAPRIDPAEGDGVQVCLHCGGSRDLSETVIFPLTPSQRQGIEDLRLVRFTEADGGVSYLGTYTAFSGSAVRQEMLRTTDFSSFEMRPIEGSLAGAKGLALFPRRIDGRYMALGRQDNQNLWLVESDDLYRWDGGAKLIAPEYAWELMQIGNCGSPIEIDEGWLVITHGVGTVRNYCIGASLLDKADPSKMLARTRRPLMQPNPQQRDGYVPNVVYSCGALVQDRTLLLPYGIADSVTGFATVTLDRLLAAME